MPADDDDAAGADVDETHEALRQALWFAIGKAVDEETIARRINATPQFIASLAEMVMTQIENVAKDLEMFARHAGRSTINTDDVLLLARRNEDLHGMMKDFIDSIKADKAVKATERERAKVTATGRKSIPNAGTKAQGRGKGKGKATA